MRAGERTARLVDQAALLLIYAVITYLVFVPRYFTPILLIVFFAFKYAVRAIALLAHRDRERRLPAIRPGPPGSQPSLSFTIGSSAVC